mgnify:CR=1 FL=1
MGTILYITSNAIHVYAIYIFIDAFLGRSCLSTFFKSFNIHLLFFQLAQFGWIFTKKSNFKSDFKTTLPIILITLQYYTSWSKKASFCDIILCDRHVY